MVRVYIDWVGVLLPQAAAAAAAVATAAATAAAAAAAASSEGRCSTTTDKWEGSTCMILLGLFCLFLMCNVLARDFFLHCFSTCCFCIAVTGDLEATVSLRAIGTVQPQLQ